LTSTSGFACAKAVVEQIAAVHAAASATNVFFIDSPSLVLVATPAMDLRHML
jgi:hypothetical protein